MIKAAILADHLDHFDLPRLVQLLHDHPDVELIAYADAKNNGTRLDELYPALTGETELVISHKINPDDINVVFIATSKETASRFISDNNLPENLCVIDLSGQFNLPAESNPFVLGIPELNRKSMVRGAKYVSMPAATTTAVALGLLPLAKNLMLNGPIHTQIVLNNHIAESEAISRELLDDDVSGQLSAALSSLQSSFSAPISGIVFSGDIPEGLIAVTTIDTNTDLDEIKRLYAEFYDDHNFTFLVDNAPDTNDVRDTNKCFIHLDKKDGQLIVTTVLDTDMKGGAGNAVHAMNLLFGLIEKVGL